MRRSLPARCLLLLLPVTMTLTACNADSPTTTGGEAPTQPSEQNLVSTTDQPRPMLSGAVVAGRSFDVTYSHETARATTYVLYKRTGQDGWEPAQALYIARGNAPAQSAPWGPDLASQADASSGPVDSLLVATDTPSGEYLLCVELINANGLSSCTTIEVEQP